MYLKNISKNKISEYFFGYGLIELLPGKSDEIPDEIASLWLNPIRQEVRVKVVEVVVFQEPDEGQKQEISEDSFILGSLESEGSPKKKV